jgi:hypothetical protein
MRFEEEKQVLGNKGKDRMLHALLQGAIILW